MRLRYLHLSHYPPINDMSVRFASGSPLQRECAIRFVVGVNGSGKSNLLRAVAELFLALADERLPPFPISLIYELGQRGKPGHNTFMVDCPSIKAKASLWMAEGWHWPDNASDDEFDAAILLMREGTAPEGFQEFIRRGTWPQNAGIALPKAVLAYTTGDLRPWRSIWNRNQDAEGFNSGLADESYDPSDERPAGWSLTQETATQIASDTPSIESVDGDWATESNPASQNLFRRPILLTPALLKCALLAIALPQAFIDTTDNTQFTEITALFAKIGKRDNNLTPLEELLQRGGWHHLVSVTFRSRLQPKAWPRNLRETAHDWLICAGEVIAEPHPTEARRTLYFDLKGDFSSYAETLTPNDNLQISTTQGEALWALLGGHEATAFELFTKLVELHQASLFDDVELRLRRHTKPDESSDNYERENDIGVLRFEELSDGEQMVLSRMALFHLLEGQQDALLLLDEPETHFNDLWKRDIVSVVDGALGKTSCEVIIATHAAIVLTDALKDELVVLERTDFDNSAKSSNSVIRILDSDIHTFGATGDHPLRDIFGASDTVGRRASRILEVLIAAASVAEQIDTQWARDSQSISSDVVNQVFTIVSETEQGMSKQSVRESLESIQHFAVHFGAVSPLRMKSVLEAFIRQTGPGYFQVELKRAWRRLLNGDGNVA